MLSREELLEKLEEIKEHQIDTVNRRPHDSIAYMNLSNVKKHIQSMEHIHPLLDQVRYLVFENSDNRPQGDNHSEISKTPIFRCCSACCRALQFYLKIQYQDDRSTYHSVNIDNGEELDKKIVTQKGRSYAESMEDDELRINPQYYD